MNTRFVTTLSALTLTALAGTTAAADEKVAELAWQQPGYVMEVVVATAPRPKLTVQAKPTAAGELAWQLPGYVQEVVVVKASRHEVLAAAVSPRMLAALENRPFMGVSRH